MNYGQATIMVVDDAPENLTLLRDMLSAKGYRVVTFPGGTMALNAAAKNPPDLILLDIVMPDMDGFEVCKRLKADDALKDIPVIFISGMNKTEDKVKAFSVGGMDYVTKPFQFEEVFARVETHIKLVRQQRELQQSYDKLRDLETLRDNLVHMIIHDMCSPLQSVLACCEMLTATQLDPSQLNLSTMAMNSVSGLIHMVNSLLDISRLEARQMPLNPIAWDLFEIAQAAVTSVASLAQAGNLTVRVEGHSAENAVDRDIIHRVFVNLLENAIKFSPDGATITIRLSSTEAATRAEVSDQGRGIPSEYHQKVFDKFSQVELRKQGQKHSSGLGLTFCKLAVEAHGGCIGVESEVGKGSTFWFELPQR